MGGSASVETGPQFVVLPAERAGESGIYRHKSVGSGKLVERLDDNIKTLYEAFSATVQKTPHAKYLGWRTGESPFKWMSYKMAHTRAGNIASGLLELGLKVKEKVGILSINRPEWMLTLHAADMQAMTLVPLYDTLGPAAVQFIVNESELPVIFVSGNKISSLLDTCEKMPTLKTLISYDEIPADSLTQAETKKIKILTIDELEELGKKTPSQPHPPSGDHIQTIMYTSGTTGDPKGVLLTNNNFMAELAGVTSRLKLEPTDIHVSYLPLAHSFERIVTLAIFYNGASMGFYRGDVRQLFDDIAVLQPTVFCSVPRLWNRLYDKVMTAVNSGGGIKKALFETAYESKVEGLKDGYLTHSLYDRLVFGKIRDRLGGRVRLMVTGSAPLSSTVMTFLRVCFSCEVLEGYGQTENCAAMTSSIPGDYSVGHVGLPFPCCEIKLVDVPDMNYFSTDKPNPRGEVCYRGPITCKGYYKQDKKTKELIDDNGWYHSGDVGEILPNGYLKIIDRSKNIFKLSQGEYIAPEKLENVFVQSEYIAQIFVYGDSLRSQLVAIAVPDFEVLLPWAKAHGRPDATEESVCQDREIVAMVLKDANEKGKANKLRGFEFLAAIALSKNPFTVDNDLITPTFKLKRPQAKAAFQKEIDTMYGGLTE